jgi:hypothetical protein
MKGCNGLETSGEKILTPFAAISQRSTSFHGNAAHPKLHLLNVEWLGLFPLF